MHVNVSTLSSFLNPIINIVLDMTLFLILILRKDLKQVTEYDWEDKKKSVLRIRSLRLREFLPKK